MFLSYSFSFSYHVLVYIGFSNIVFLPLLVTLAGYALLALCNTILYASRTTLVSLCRCVWHDNLDRMNRLSLYFHCCPGRLLCPLAWHCLPPFGITLSLLFSLLITIIVVLLLLFLSRCYRYLRSHLLSFRVFSVPSALLVLLLILEHLRGPDGIVLVLSKTVFR